MSPLKLRCGSLFHLHVHGIPHGCSNSYVEELHNHYSFSPFYWGTAVYTNRWEFLLGWGITPRASRRTVASADSQRTSSDNLRKRRWSGFVGEGQPLLLGHEEVHSSGSRTTLQHLYCDVPSRQEAEMGTPSLAHIILLFQSFHNPPCWRIYLRKLF